MRINYRGMAITLVALSLADGALAAPVETVLYNFCSLPNCTDGAYPAAGLIVDKEGALYGTTGYGGSSTACVRGLGCGTVFKLTPPAEGKTAWKETVLQVSRAAPTAASPGPA